MCQRLSAGYAVAHSVEHLVFAVETVFHLAFGVECLDYSQSSQSLFDVRHQESPLVLRVERLALQSLAYTTHYKAGKRQQNKDKHGQLPRQVNHHGQAADYHDRILEEHVERRHDGIFDFGHVTRHTGHDIAFAGFGEV